MRLTIRTFADRLGARLNAHARRIARDERGVSLIEFAMLLPLMLTLFIGAIEISQAVALDRKVVDRGALGRRPGRAGDVRQQRRSGQYF